MLKIIRVFTTSLRQNANPSAQFKQKVITFDSFGIFNMFKWPLRIKTIQHDSCHMDWKLKVIPNKIFFFNSLSRLVEQVLNDYQWCVNPNPDPDLELFELDSDSDLDSELETLCQLHYCEALNPMSSNWAISNEWSWLLSIYNDHDQLQPSNYTLKNSDDTTRWTMLPQHFVKPLHTLWEILCW